MAKKIHPEIKEFLTKIGLTQTETHLYISGLISGGSTAASLAKQSGIRRTTAYSALTALAQKGMAGVRTQSGKTVYTMKEPHLIELHLNNQIDELKDQQLEFGNILPLFDGVLTGKGARSEVSSFSGIQGVKTVVDTALYCVSRRWKIISPERNFFSEGDKQYSDYFIKVRKQRGIRARSLWEESFVKKRTFDEVAFEFRDPRILPKAVAGKFDSTVILFDNKVAFINSTKESSAVLIESEEINKTMEVFFDGLWASGRPIAKRYIRK